MKGRTLAVIRTTVKAREAVKGARCVVAAKGENINHCCSLCVNMYCLEPRTDVLPDSEIEFVAKQNSLHSRFRTIFHCSRSLKMLLTFLTGNGGSDSE